MATGEPVYGSRPHVFSSSSYHAKSNISRSRHACWLIDVWLYSNSSSAPLFCCPHGISCRSALAPLRRRAVPMRCTIREDSPSLDSYGSSAGETEEEPDGAISSEEKVKENHTSSTFAAAVALIIGTAVGPGILGLPAATLPAGIFPSSFMIIASWVYVVSSILLVAELSFGLMEDQNTSEVSFTGLATHTLGYHTGCAVAAIYAVLNYALLVACIAGLGSILQKWMPFLPSSCATLLCPTLVAAVVTWGSFWAIDNINRVLCALMLASILSLLALGVYSGRGTMVTAWLDGSWSLKALLPSIPVAVLTLGFHVITPVVCSMIGHPEYARRAILCGGLVPLVMVLSWNAVVLAITPPSATSVDPIKLLLSVSSFSGPAVQAFAFSALGTTLIGYALSFPRQLSDTFLLFNSMNLPSLKQAAENTGHYVCESSHSDTGDAAGEKRKSGNMWTLILALAPPAVMSGLYPGAFTAALDFAGIYANCFLFGFLPPVMAWIYRYKSVYRSAPQKPNLAPGGQSLLFVLLTISVFLGLGQFKR